MKYRVVPYIKVIVEEEELFNSREEAEASFNEDDETIFVIEEVEEEKGVL